MKQPTKPQERITISDATNSRSYALPGIFFVHKRSKEVTGSKDPVRPLIMPFPMTHVSHPDEVTFFLIAYGMNEELVKLRKFPKEDVRMMDELEWNLYLSHHMSDFQDVFTEARKRNKLIVTKKDGERMLRERGFPPNTFGAAAAHAIALKMKDPEEQK